MSIDPSVPYALTRSQELIWLGQQFTPDKPLYNMVFAFRFDRHINHALFKQAFEHVVATHDGLRTHFETTKSTAKQYISTNLDYEIELVDFSRHRQPQENANKWIEQRKLRKLNLADCCFDTALLCLDESRYIWYFNQHHLITDVWSTSLIFQSVMQAYQALLQAQPLGVILPPSIVDFHEYEAKQRKQVLTTDKAKQAGSSPVKTAFYGTTFSPGNGRSIRLSHPISRQQSRRIELLLQHKSIATFSAQLTKFNVFVTVLCAYLGRTTNLSVVTIGVPIHNRTQMKHQQTTGLFVELFPLSVDVDEQMSFLELYRSVALKTQSLLQDAGPGRSQAESVRRYNVVLNFINAQFEQKSAGLGDVDWVHCDYCDPAHFLRVHVCQFIDNQSAKLIFDVDKQLFEQSGKPEIVAHFLSLLEAFVDNPDIKYTSAAINSDDEKHWLLNHYNPPPGSLEKPQATSILALFQQSVANASQQTAVWDGQQAYSFQQLDQLSDALTVQLKRRNVTGGDLVAIYAQRSAQCLVSILAVLKSGAAFIPLEDNLPLERIAYIFKQSQPKLVISHDSLIDNLNGMEVSKHSVDLNELEKTAVSEPINLPHDLETQLAYVMYTSGSTGQPKGVMIGHQSLHDYVSWAIKQYTRQQSLCFPLYSSIGFDLTLTSIFVPLCSAGSIRIYRSHTNAVDTSIIDVFEDNQVDIVKLTPAHLALLIKRKLDNNKIQALILGGEDLKVSLAKQISNKLSGRIRVFNEYGPTEATVGCMIHQYDNFDDVGSSASVPIGIPAEHARIYLLDDGLNAVPIGVPGEIYIGGSGLSLGYLNDPKRSAAAFLEDPFYPGERMYKTGDLATMLPTKKLVYLSRKDDQYKFHGIRIEKAEIEQALMRFADVDACHVVKISGNQQPPQNLKFCARCGIASNYPDIKFNQNEVCNICLEFEHYHDKASQYFGELTQLNEIIARRAADKTGNYDCMMLFSGGKDSTYALYRLSQMGFSVYAMTLDNGFISAAAKSNISRTVRELGIDHEFAMTHDMNDIFVDSLKRHCSVCYGCFKTIYTLAMKIARDKGINCIVTGLSRGQFFETRLTKESFAQHNFDPDEIDQEVLQARKNYHSVNDIVTQRLANGLFDDERIFSQIEFVDFYRYCDVSLTEIYSFLESNVPWIRPEDTGRSTNCTINDTGILYHKTRQGFHNYALPYSWDVRLGLKTRDQAMDELNDEIDAVQVAENLEKIGFDRNQLNLGGDEDVLVAYYTADNKIPGSQLRGFLRSQLAASIIPNYFVHLDELPLTDNGKIDNERLPNPLERQRHSNEEMTQASTIEEKALVTIFAQVLRLKQIGIHDNYFDMGGDSIKAIQISASAIQIGITIKPGQLFDFQTIAELAKVVKNQLPVNAWQHQVCGDAPLTPIQKWFVTQPSDSHNQFCHSVVLKLHQTIAVDQLQIAIDKILAQHDVLRHRFEEIEHGWQQCAPQESAQIRINAVGLSASPVDLQIAEHESRLSSQLDITAGHLLACALLESADKRDQHLLVIIHHLAVDAVSWGVFLEDLDILLKQLYQKQTLLLPFKTSAYLHWAAALAVYQPDYAEQASSSQLKAYHPVIRLDPDQSQTRRDSIVTISLDVPMTRLQALLDKKHNPTTVGLQDWLLSALARTLSVYCGRDAICINVESHGRNEISTNLNVTRTMGWFTCINSVCLDLDLCDTSQQLIEQINQRSESGFDQFLNQSRLPDRHPQQNSGVLFNFLGSHTDYHYQSFAISQRLKLIRSDSSIMQHGFEINVLVVDNVLRIEWSFDGNKHSHDSIQALLDDVRKRLVSEARKVSAAEKTKPAYLLADLDDDDLAAISRQLIN